MSHPGASDRTSPSTSLWSADPHAWADLQEPQGKSLWIAMLSAANVGWRSRVLDVGCGAGGAAGVARGLGAQVCGVDLCEPLLAIARQRVRKAEFHVADMGRLPCRAGGYSIVISANALEWADDPEAAVREMARVCAPQGRLAIGGWSEKSDQAQLFRALDELAPGASHFPLSPTIDQTLGNVVARVGARSLAQYEGETISEYDSQDAAWRAQRAAGWTQAAIREAGEAKVQEAFFGVIERFTHPSGHVRMRNHYRFLIAVKQ